MTRRRLEAREEPLALGKRELRYRGPLVLAHRTLQPSAPATLPSRTTYQHMGTGKDRIEY